MRKIIINSLKAGVTFGILFYLYRGGMLDLGKVKNAFSNPVVIVASFLMLCGTNLAGVTRWKLLLDGQDLQVSWFEALKLCMIGTFFNTAIPGAVSGDLVKGYYVVKQQQDGRGRIKAFTTLLLDRLLGLSALICVSFAAMLFNFNSALSNSLLRPLCGLITVLWIGVVTFFAFVLVEWSFSAKIIRLLQKLPAGEYFVKLYEAVKAYETCRHYVYKGLAISVGIHCCIIGVLVLISQSLGGFEAVSGDKFFFLVPFGLLVTAIPVAPAGLGTGHVAFLALFKMVDSKGGADLFTAYVTLQIAVSMIGGLFYLRHRENLPQTDLAMS